MPECTVQLWYNKQRVKKDGMASLYLQVIVGCEHAEMRLKSLQWPADKIDWKKKALKPRSAEDPELVTYNALIERERSKYWNVVLNFLKQDRPFKLADIFKEINRYNNGHHFCEFMEQSIRQRQKTLVKKDMIKETTARVHRTTLKLFREFLGGQDVEIVRVDGDLLELFVQWSRNSVVENSVWVRLQNIKSYLSYAARQKLAVNPDYKRCIIRVEEPNPTWLEEHEVNALLALYGKGELSTEDMRNLRAFLFATFTGLRISDLSRWNKSWIKGDFISFVPQKRKKSARDARPLTIPIMPIARDFINDLRAESFELPKDQVYNRELKKLAVLAGIDKNLTSHVARHTFATRHAINGMRESYLSKLMGHKSTLTTMVYIHISEDVLAREMMKNQNQFKIPGRDKGNEV